jgi:hypothetical protein
VASATALDRAELDVYRRDSRAYRTCAPSAPALAAFTIGLQRLEDIEAIRNLFLEKCRP